MTSKENYADLNAIKVVNKVNDLTIGEDTTDQLTITSKLNIPRGTTGHVLTKQADGSVDFAASSGGGGGGSGIVNNRIDGDLTIGEDTSEMLTIASKLNIPGGESGQVLTKGTDGSVEYGPTAFPSVALPNDKQLQHKTLTGENTITVSANGSAIFNDGTDDLKVTITPSILSAQVMVTVDTVSTHFPYMSFVLQKQVGSATATIVLTTTDTSFKFIDTLTDKTAVTYTILINNQSSISRSIRCGVANATLSDLFDDTNFKFMWQAGREKTVKNEYTVTEVGNTMNVSIDNDDYKYISPQAGNYLKITGTTSNALLPRHQKNITFAFAIDFTLTSSSEFRHLFYQTDT